MHSTAGFRFGCMLSVTGPPPVMRDVRRIMRVVQILTVLAFGFIASSAAAGSMWFQLDSRNIKSQPLAFKVKTENTPQGGVLFYVDIESKKAVLSRNVGASLTLASGKKARADTKEKEYGKGVRFAFEVSPNYLAQSKFAFKDIGGSENPWVNDVYWFYLKDFASEK